jgi:transposon, resolvase
VENLHEYGERNGIKYHATWNRFREGKIPGAFKTGRILIPTRDDETQNRCAIYARVSTHKQKDDLEHQRQRLADFASTQG